ncbi:unnamed protein product [Effrenium voratum]|nr:unnamed protein product [Effrenium voratum]
MLEEAFKAVEGPVARRSAESRAAAEPGAVYSSANKAYDRKAAAAADVLYLDALVEDVRHSGQGFCRIPADFEKYFNTIQLAQVDAVRLARGFADSTRRLYQDAFQDLRSMSSPELSKAAQEPVMRMREQSKACYGTSHGREISAAAYADDAEHYGRGAADLLDITDELAAASCATGIGFSWHKFRAYASDWDAARLLPEGAERLLPDGLAVTGRDIWQGGVCNAILPRSEAEDAEKLLGKRGTLLDKHALARQDLHEKLRNVRLRATLRHCAWDEVLMLYEWCARGHINYAPLMGFLRPPQMHDEDAALQRLILARLGVRRAAERMGLLATRQQGGLQLISVVESCLAATASDLISLLSGSALASAVARDSLRHALNLSPDEVENCSGVVPDAFRLLAGYGVYVTVGPDRFCSRMLDCLRAATADPCQPLLGPYNATAFSQELRYCRVGPLANAVRATALTAAWPL